MRFEISVGDASNWTGSAIDLVLTNPYAPLPQCLWGVPTIVRLFEGKGSRQARAEGWIGRPLTQIGKWGKGSNNTVYVAGLPVRKIKIAGMMEAPFEPGRGWFPLDLPVHLLTTYARPGWTVWDGFMGRGTVGKACQQLGLGFVGLDIQPDRVALARRYLAAE